MGWLRGLGGGSRSDFNGDNRNLNNDNGSLFGIVLAVRTFKMNDKSLYEEVYNLSNLILAWRKARKGKTRRAYVIEFERNLERNLLDLHHELKNQIYAPRPLKTFILRDPKTRKISKADFRDRVIHHALVRIIEPIFDKGFIYDSCANRMGKGSLFAIKRFDYFKRKLTHNLKSEGFCLKADIKHYFEEVDHEILIRIIRRKISDERVIWLIRQILQNGNSFNNLGMPLGNLTSQFTENLPIFCAPKLPRNF